MKKTMGYIFASISNFIAGTCFLVAAIFQKNTVPKSLFYIAAICCLISAAGFLYTYFKNKKKK